MGLSIVTAYSVCRKHFSNVFLPEIRYRLPAMNAARLNRKKEAAMMSYVLNMRRKISAVPIAAAADRRGTFLILSITCSYLHVEAVCAENRERDSHE